MVFCSLSSKHVKNSIPMSVSSIAIRLSMFFFPLKFPAQLLRGTCPFLIYQSVIFSSDITQHNDKERKRELQSSLALKILTIFNDVFKASSLYLRYFHFTSVPITPSVLVSI